MANSFQSSFKRMEANAASKSLVGGRPNLKVVVGDFPLLERYLSAATGLQDVQPLACILHLLHP